MELAQQLNKQIECDTKNKNRIEELEKQIKDMPSPTGSKVEKDIDLNEDEKE